MSDKLFIDFETASDLNLKSVGADVYCRHRSTYVRCMAWAVNDERAHIWTPMQEMPLALKNALRSYEVWGWNVRFERLVFDHVLGDRYPSPTWSQYRCAQALARVNALPGKLADAARILKVPTQKQDTAIMKKLADAQYVPQPWETEALRSYCMDDVLATRQIHDVLPPLSDNEQYLYELNEYINDRGVLIDYRFVSTMLLWLATESAALNEELAEITDGAVTKFTQVSRIKDYVGITGSLDKNACKRLMRDPALSENQRRVIEIRQDAARSSVAKYQSLLDQRCSDGRVRGVFQFAGAGQTGRFSSTKPQLHNLPRDVPPDAAQTIENVKRYPLREFQLLDGRPIIPLASSLIRPSIVAPEGKLLGIADYKGVEARGLPWLAGEASEVAAYARGEDRYIEDACSIFHCTPEEVTPATRQIGKVVRLACGFSGKKGALLQMAEQYGIELTEEEASRIATAWHKANPWAEKFAIDLESSAVCAANNPGEVIDCGKISYQCLPIADVLVLRCRLPSGRVICYHDVLIEEGQYGYQLSAIKPREAHRTRLWHGIYAENVTQAACNDLLRYAMVLFHAEGIEVVAHVHDELVFEVDDVSTAEYAARLMESRPSWAEDFPLAVEYHTDTRYTK